VSTGVCSCATAVLENGVVGCGLVEIGKLVFEIACVSHVAEIGKGAVWVGEVVLLCLKGDYFFVVVWGTMGSGCLFCLEEAYALGVGYFGLDSWW
jgi:hypothetical protein